MLSMHDDQGMAQGGYARWQPKNRSFATQMSEQERRELEEVMQADRRWHQQKEEHLKNTRDTGDFAWQATIATGGMKQDKY
ncbi:unnamed protein product, partial [Mesorhabditis spiculigera]